MPPHIPHALLHSLMQAPCLLAALRTIVAGGNKPAGDLDVCSGSAVSSTLSCLRLLVQLRAAAASQPNGSLHLSYSDTWVTHGHHAAPSSPHAYHSGPIATQQHPMQMHSQHSLCMLTGELLLQRKTPTTHQAKLSGQHRWAVPGHVMKAGRALAGVPLMQIPRVK